MMTAEQVDVMFRQALLRQIARVDAVVAADKLDPTFDVGESIETRSALPFRLQLIERSKFNPPPWSEHRDADAR